MAPPLYSSSRDTHGGFSLVEVALSLGIICIAVIPLMGLLTVGFDSAMESTGEVRASIIAQKIMTEVGMSSYSQLQSRTYFLDSFCNEVDEAESVFTATLVVQKGPSSNLLVSPSLARITIDITGPALRNNRYIHSATIADTGI
jgi:uncharacterized protein (TIGR02598 family)